MSPTSSRDSFPGARWRSSSLAVLAAVLGLSLVGWESFLNSSLLGEPATPATLGSTLLRLAADALVLFPFAWLALVAGVAVSRRLGASTGRLAGAACAASSAGIVLFVLLVPALSVRTMALGALGGAGPVLQSFADVERGAASGLTAQIDFASRSALLDLVLALPLLAVAFLGAALLGRLAGARRLAGAVRRPVAVGASAVAAVAVAASFAATNATASATGLLSRMVTTAFAPTAGADDLLGRLPRANSGALEGSDASAGGVEEEQPPMLAAGGFDIPTGGPASPLFGAGSFEQKLLRFEEFGTQPMPQVYVPTGRMAGPPDPQSCPDGADVHDFLSRPLWPAPTRLANDLDENPWKNMIQQHLGRTVAHPPAEGRPPGEGWAHQRWDDFPPEVYFQSAQTGATQNTGLRDSRQRHQFLAGEFGPGGLYHNTTDAPTSAGTLAGIDVRFHPALPIQDPHSLWTFDGTFPPKLLMARYGQAILFRHWNALPIDPGSNGGFGMHTITTHEHNGHNPSESDGYTNAFFFPGQYYDYRWPMQLAGYDTVNTTASDPRAGSPDGNGGIRRLRGDWRETMSTHWFHDHMLDFTATNVYKGNAVMMNYYSAIDRGNEGLNDGVNLRLPSGTALDWGNRDYDVNLVIADKAWDASGQLWFNIFNLDGFMGDNLLTNWQYHPYLDVRARRYRFRILNGSVSRYLKIALVDQNGTPVPFHMVANDGNLMEHTVPFNGLGGTQRGILPVQGIAERYDIVVDFSQFQPGDKLYFVNTLEHDDGRSPKQQIPLQDILSGNYQPVVDASGFWTGGDPCVGKFLEFRVQPYAGVDRSMDPADYEPGKKTMIPLHRPTQTELDNALHRTFTFGRSSGADDQPWTIKTDGGQGFGMDPRRISAAPNIGDLTSEGMGHLEVWRIENGGGGWSHPVHVHFEEGIVLTRGDQTPPIWEQYARKDVYRIGVTSDSLDSVEMAIRFREFAGTYMEHCHNTQHEDHAMLLRWDIENPGQFTLLPTPVPTWDGVQYVSSVALPTFRTGDGTGGPGGGGTTPPAPTIFVSRAQYKASWLAWRVQGSAPTQVGGKVRIRVGPDLTGAIVGGTTVKADGTWSYVKRNSPVTPGPTSSVSIETTWGETLLDVPLELFP